MNLTNFLNFSNLRNETKNDLANSIRLLKNLQSLQANKKTCKVNANAGQVDLCMNLSDTLSFTYDIRYYGKVQHYEWTLKDIQIAIKSVKQIRKALEYELSRIDKEIKAL